MKYKTPAVLLAVLLAFSLLVPNATHAVEDKPKDDVRNLLDSLFGGGEGASNSNKEDNRSKETGNNQNAMGQKVVEDDYSHVWAEWEKQKLGSPPLFETVIHPNQFGADGAKIPLTPASDAHGYDEAVFTWNDLTPEIDFPVNVPEDGLYRIQIEYFALPGKITPPERGVKIDGEYPFFEARRIVFPRLWQNKEFQKDDLGNEIYAKQEELPEWQQADLIDASYYHNEPLLLPLKKGANTVQLTYLRGAMQIGRVTVKSSEKLAAYEEYLKNNGSGKPDRQVLLTYEAEKTFVKSDSNIEAEASADITVTPQHKSLMTLNTIGGTSWKLGRQGVTWKISVPETGSYQLAFKYIQNLKKNMPSFRTVKIDGKIPFREVAAYPFAYTGKWKNGVLGDSEGNPYRFHLTAGEHYLTLIADPSPYRPVIETARQSMSELGEINLEIKMATGNTLDMNRDWDITEQMPDISERLNGIAARLREAYRYLNGLSGKSPDEGRNLLIGAQQLEKLAQNPSTIPYRFDRIAEGTGSVNQRLGDMLQVLPLQQLQIDKLYVYADEKLPSAEAGWWKKFTSWGQSLGTSFSKDYSSSNPVDEDTVRIWVNRPRFYVRMMQHLANQEFTPKTGIKVSFSIMPNEQKIILANASGVSPDAALGLTEKFPYELALRGALADLSQFPDYRQVLERFAPGAMLPYMFDQGTYALPESQNFWVLYYRKDIMDKLQLPVPETWDDVLAILPDLQRYGMNFYTPIAGASATKNFGLISPFIYQHGGELFAKDGTKTAVDSEEALEGFKQMTNLFTLYNVPLQVARFSNDFRDGRMPIGISNYATYVELLTTAPELTGSWRIAPFPGMKNDKGEIVRWAPGAGSAAALFKNSDKQRQAWDFLRWWTSAEAQTAYGNLMETVYGPEFRWNTANLEAFSQLPWPEDDQKVILEQWKWMKEVSHVPGDYMLERELLNAWNKIVIDGKNARKTLEDAAIIANREMTKKLEEFGYMKDGKVVRKLRVPTIEDVEKARGDTD